MINKKAFPNYSERLFYLKRLKIDKSLALNFKYNSQSLIHNTHSSFLISHS